MEHQVQELLEERKKLSLALTTVTWVEEVFPSDANFLLILVDNADLRYKQLVEQGIVVRNRSSQPLCENCLRITVGMEEENTRLLQAMKELSS